MLYMYVSREGPRNAFYIIIISNDNNNNNLSLNIIHHTLLSYWSLDLDNINIMNVSGLPYFVGAIGIIHIIK